MAITDNLIRWFNCNDNAANTIVIDSTGTANASSVTNTSSITKIGLINKSLNFVAANSDMISDGSAPDFSGVNPFSFSLWVYSTSTADTAFVWYTPNGSTDNLMIQSSGTNLYFQRGGVSISSTTLENVWVHYVMTFDGTTLKGYKNGSVLSQATSTSLTSGTKVLQWGRRNTSGTLYQSGRTDLVGVWTRAITDAEVTTLYNSGLGYSPYETVTLTTNLVRYFKMDDNAASTAVIDATGNGNATSSTNTNGLYNATGKINSAFQLDGVDDNINCGVVHDFSGRNPYTWNIWTRETAKASTYTMTAAIGNGLFLKIQSYATESYIQRSGASPTGPNLSINNWYMLTHVYDGYNIKFYVNGSYYSQAVATEELVVSGTNAGILCIGSNVLTGQYLTGKIDETGIWTRALSATEISQLYNSGLAKAYPLTATTDGTISGATYNTDTPSLYGTPLSGPGWTHKVMGIANASVGKVIGVVKSVINKIMGV